LHNTLIHSLGGPHVLTFVTFNLSRVKNHVNTSRKYKFFKVKQAFFRKKQSGTRVFSKNLLKKQKTGAFCKKEFRENPDNWRKNFKKKGMVLRENWEKSGEAPKF